MKISERGFVGNAVSTAIQSESDTVNFEYDDVLTRSVPLNDFYIFADVDRGKSKFNIVRKYGEDFGEFSPLVRKIIKNKATITGISGQRDLPGDFKNTSP